MNRVFATGFFASCTPVAEDTRDGVRVTLDCRPNPVLTGVTLLGATALPEAVVAAAFEPQLGKTLNFRDFHAALARRHPRAPPPARPCPHLTRPARHTRTRAPPPSARSTPGTSAVARPGRSSRLSCRTRGCASCACARPSSAKSRSGS